MNENLNRIANDHHDINELKVVVIQRSKYEPRNNHCQQVQSISVITNSVINDHSVITNIFLSRLVPFSTKIKPVIANPGYNEQKLPVLNCP